MKIEMPTLPYATNALEPVISEQTINFHYGKHLQNYVNTLTSLVKDTEWADKSVEDIVKGAPDGPLFNNAGQVLNHVLYFSQFRSPRQNNQPEVCWKPSTLRSAVSRTSRRNSRRLQRHSLALAGHGSHNRKTESLSLRKKLTEETLFAKA